jgi:diguanylate cyclase (GGDEF)-like protein
MTSHARSHNLRFGGYMTVVSISGIGALACDLVRSPSWLSLLGVPTFWVFLALCVFGELLPISVRRGQETETITSSTAFVFAAFLAWSVWPAIVLLTISCLVDDLHARRAWWKSAFNVGQNVLSFLAADAVLQGSVLLLGGGAGDRVTLRLLPAVAASALAFMVVNGALVLVAIALAQRSVVFGDLRDGLASQLMTTGVLLVLAPVVATVINDHGSLLPLLALPVLAVCKGGRASARIAHEALHDPLTNLPNRVALLEVLEHRLANEDPCSVVLINLDHFRSVNDTLGFAAGDLALVEVAQRLRDIAGDATVARLAADEFAMLASASERDAVTVAGAVAQAFAEPLTVDGFVIAIEASSGLAMPEPGIAADVLMRRGEVAMHQAKTLRTGLEIYRPEHDPNSRTRLSLLSDLRHAIAQDELVLHYQPKIDTHTGRVVGAEALIRWPRPEGGFTPPDEFIPFAEQSGLIGPLTDWVLRTAIREAACWPTDGYELHVAINVSVRNLYDRQFPDRVRAALDEAGFPASRLECEITEGTLMSDPIRALGVLRSLNEIGVSLSLDDFGTGQSYLAQLQRLPVDAVKIDRSFVTHMLDTRANLAVVRTIIDLGSNLDLIVVAEGVETADVLATLARLGCHVAQGYHISRPLPAAAFREFVADSNALAGASVSTSTPEEPSARGAGLVDGAAAPQTTTPALGDAPRSTADPSRRVVAIGCSEPLASSLVNRGDLRRIRVDVAGNADDPPSDEHADAVIVDLDTTDLTDFDPRHLQGRGRTPIVAIGTGGRLDQRLTAVRVGAHRYLAKPVTARALLDTLDSLWAPHREHVTVVALELEAGSFAVLEDSMTAAGARFVATSSASEFWDHLDSVDPALVLVEGASEPFDTADLCRAIRSEARWQHLGLVVTSPLNDPGALQELHGAGADDVLVGPLTDHDVTRVVARLERTSTQRRLAGHDGLTGLLNRTTTAEALERMTMRSASREHTMAVALIDLDHFKDINDRFGHPVGDDVLRIFGDHLGNLGIPVVGRWGGEEFLVADLGTADRLRDRLQQVTQALAALQIRPRADGEPFSVTFSAGVAALPDDAHDLDGALRLADAALYRAKAIGRDRIVCSGESARMRPEGSEQDRSAYDVVVQARDYGVETDDAAQADTPERVAERVAPAARAI